MASKGQKFVKTKPEIKREIVAKYFAGLGSTYSLSKEYKVSKNSIVNWIRKARRNEDPASDNKKKHSGRKTDKNLDYKEKYEILKKFQAFIKARRAKK